ncbi:MAG: hypothetical protein K6F76_01325 [Clostridiales bacterium]|nr:hypothetical protein [Clostridiales bacterium]
MSSKLRPLYDKLYMSIDTWVVGFRSNKKGKKRAKYISRAEDFNKEYRTQVLPFWKKYGVKPKKYWFVIFSQNHEHVDARYIPNDIWFKKIIPHFNHLLFAQAFQDKCMNNVFVPDMAHPKTVVKNINGIFYDDDLHVITKENAIERCMDSGRFIIKPSVGSGQGDDIRFYNGFELSENDAVNIFNNYKKNFLIQEKATQHKVLSSLNENSLNTLRIVTFLYKNEVRILSVVLRMGAGESEIDNVSKGGFACKVNFDGRLDKYAVNRKGEWVTEHPNGTVFEDIVIPNYDKIIESVKNAAEKLGHFCILGWDIAVGENAEPIFIEYNVIPDQNQKTWGPTFGDKTEEILDEVYAKERKAK